MKITESNNAIKSKRYRPVEWRFFYSKFSSNTARATGLEPAASPVTGECSNQLSYARSCLGTKFPSDINVANLASFSNYRLVQTVQPGGLNKKIRQPRERLALASDVSDAVYHEMLSLCPSSNWAAAGLCRKPRSRS